MHMRAVEYGAHHLVECAGKTYRFRIRSVTEGDKPRAIDRVVNEQQPTAWRVVASRSEEGVMGPV